MLYAATRTWPTREEWTAKAEYSVRTACYLTQRVTANPAAWLTADELTEARTLATQIVKATRTALTRASRASDRPMLNKYGRSAADQYADVDDLSRAWGHIGSIAKSVHAAADQVRQLDALAAKMLTARNAAAQADLDAAIEKAVAVRNTDEGWQQELDRRARIDAGPVVTWH
jgi:hypothetical protein